MKEKFEGKSITEQLDIAKEIMSEAQSVLHWNELRDSIKDIVHPTVIKYLDTSGMITDVLISNGVYPASRLKGKPENQPKVKYKYDELHYPENK